MKVLDSGNTGMSKMFRRFEVYAAFLTEIPFVCMSSYRLYLLIRRYKIICCLPELAQYMYNVMTMTITLHYQGQVFETYLVVNL